MRSPAAETGIRYEAARAALLRAGLTVREARATLLWAQGLTVRQVRLRMQGHHDRTSDHMVIHLLQGAATKLVHADLQERYAVLKDVLSVWRGDRRAVDEIEFPPTGGWFIPRFSDANRLQVDDLTTDSRECILKAVETGLTVA